MGLPTHTVFDAIYESPWHHPAACWVAAPLILGALWQARPGRDAGTEQTRLFRLALLGQLVIVADALCTGAWSPLPQGSRSASVAELLFVVLGDLRYFVLLEQFAAPRRGRILRALGYSLAVPLLCGALGAALPSLFPLPRWQYLIYEALFLLWLGVLHTLVLPRYLTALRPQGGDRELGRWLRVLTGFEVAQYALWALADLLILAGVPAGLLLRLWPNLLYYVGFVPVAYFAAPWTLRRLARAG
jgi:hypothetical protein